MSVFCRVGPAAFRRAGPPPAEQRQPCRQRLVGRRSKRACPTLRSYFWTGSWIVVLVVCVVLLGRQAVAQDAVPGWHTNLEDARKLAESTGKPLFITFRCVR